MRIARRWTRLAVAVWLGCQAVALVSVPIALVSTVASAEADTCCPGMAPGQVCPMHHSASSSRACRITNACGSPAAALVMLLGIIGLPPSAPVTTFVRTPGLPVARVERSPISRIPVPDFPPPRA